MQAKKPSDTISVSSTPSAGADFAIRAAGTLSDPVATVVADIAALKTALSPVLSPEQRASLDRASVSVSRLASSIATIATVGGLDESRLVPDIREVSLDDIYASVSGDLVKRALVSKRLLGIAIPHDLPAVAADPYLIGQVLTNVIDNALLHSREGGQVTLRAAVDGNMVKVSVADHGDGIGSREIDSLFTKFFRTDASKQLYAGSGLGLYASRAVVERHKGTIGVQSQPGEGTTVTFTVPVFRALTAGSVSDDDLDKYSIKG